MSSDELLAYKFASLEQRLESVVFSYRKAVKIVGGEKRLERLLLDGKIRYEKPEGSRNSMWQFNAADVIRNVKPAKRETLQHTRYNHLCKVI
ncbi:MAG: hypothetical protein IKW46_01695 [Bacteroidaceae bacterium]|nr:hypothetical protein [Bacteroidaceae bacterium]